MYRYGLIGFGGLGKKHYCNLLKIAEKRKDFCLASICGTTPEEAGKSVSLNIGTVDSSAFDFSGCHFYQDYKEMIDQENLDFVLSVLPTYLHEEVAVYALQKGVHVFSEKAMALTLEGCDAMISAAKESGKALMIGQVCRFNRTYARLKEIVDSGCYGKVRKVTAVRNSQMPLWTWQNWILDPSKSGGCLLDMHVHDLDLINWIFGMPKQVSAIVGNSKIKQESVSSRLFYDDFVAEVRADWSLPQSYPFTAQFQVDFDEATVVIQGEKFLLYRDDGLEEESYNSEDAFIREIEDFLALALDRIPCETTSAESVRESVRLAMAEMESAEKNEIITL